MDGDDAVDKAREELFGEDGVLLDQFGEVVESRRCRSSGELVSGGRREEVG